MKIAMRVGARIHKIKIECMMQLSVHDPLLWVAGYREDDNTILYRRGSTIEGAVQELLKAYPEVFNPRA